MNNWKYPDTAGWKEWRFDFDGHEFVSKVNPDSDMATQINFVGDNRFISMNKDALVEMLGFGLTETQIKDTLAFINEGALNAVIELI